MHYKLGSAEARTRLRACVTKEHDAAARSLPRLLSHAGSAVRCLAILPIEREACAPAWPPRDKPVTCGWMDGRARSLARCFVAALIAAGRSEGRATTVAWPARVGLPSNSSCERSPWATQADLTSSSHSPTHGLHGCHSAGPHANLAPHDPFLPFLFYLPAIVVFRSSLFLSDTR